MKKIIYGLLATLSGLVLLFSYRTSLDVVAPAAAMESSTDASSSTSDSTSSSGSTSGSGSDSSSTSGSGSDSSSSSTSGSTSSQPQSSAPAATTSGLVDGTYTGDSTSTRYGPVQVQITVSGGVVTDVQAVDYPNGNGKDRQINSYAIPRLVSETIDAQSAQINMVSGATYTSQGYKTSLQSALDQAQS
ncbi:uncharacterized protein with FMN-binding domain [Microbacterium endophyticum]|uniref:Uncharacterized protein with FMN-binding domain n=1 Tax=Microbacterium endophyticum TaxID=1526412 RepID=A0A7W4V1K5_9MICO|nr:FMN-binding protein [Microbacterium endophyticum]MBB2975193.1 uncharacterized protein with FMN-binding domain [Microbacterium endophyticum]NIK37595.1 uncharacterized protein with FMN-binding domain [Microbacterium endophyticum]